MTRVLIVDDKVDNLAYLNSLLLASGMQVDIARHGIEALDKARQRPPQLIIADLLMPVMDGYVLLRHWKGDARLKTIPFIVYTATYTNPDDERLALRLGADAFILKPCEPQELIGRIRDLLHSQIAAAIPAPPSFDIEETVVLKEYNEALIRKLEEKTVQLEQLNRQLQREVVQRSEIARTQIGILNALAANVAVIDADRMIRTVNDSWRRVAAVNLPDLPAYGIGADYIAVCGHTEGPGDEHLAEVEAGIRGVLSGESRQFSLEYLSNTAPQTRWFRLVATPLDDRAGSGAVIMHLDVTDRKGIEQRLRESQELYLQLLNSTAEGIYGLDVNGLCTFCNPAGARMLGLDHPDELVGQNVHERYHHSHADGTKYPAERCRVYGAFRHGVGVHVDDEWFFRRDGSSFPVEYWSFPLRRSGEVVGAVVAFLDISERRNLEAQFLQAQKMEAIGRLAGGVAHDFNNLLQVVLTCAEIIEKGMDPNDEYRKFTAEIAMAGKRGGALTRQLLAFSRSQAWRPEILDLNQVIRDIEAMLQRMLGEDLRVHIDCRSAAARVKADLSQIEQVLMNLAVNARDAMRGGGDLLIRTENVEKRADAANAMPDGQAVGGLQQRCVRLSVLDSGCGMDQATMARIFEPFFTTKPVGEGSGLGLSTVYGIVKRCGGSIAVDSVPGKGTRFTIDFPLVPDGIVGAEPPGRSSAGAAGAESAARGTETLLLVEDEDSLRDLVAETLRGHGYTVLSAKLYESAVELFARHSGRIDLLLTDVILSDISGTQLAAKLHAVNSSIKVLYMTGYTDGFPTIPESAMPAAKLLKKPFSADALLLEVRAALDERGDHSAARRGPSISQ